MQPNNPLAYYLSPSTPAAHVFIILLPLIIFENFGQGSMGYIASAGPGRNHRLGGPLGLVDRPVEDRSLEANIFFHSRLEAMLMGIC